jgi:long-chain acyl-CoA synthetase
MSTVYRPETLPQLLLQRAEEMPHGLAQRHKRLGIWQTFTWRQLAEKILDLACGLHEIGVAAGDTVTILGDNEPEALWAELAAHCLGAKTVSLYPDISGPELAFICDDATTRFIVAQDQEQVDKCLALAVRPGLLGIAYWDPTGMWSYQNDDLMDLAEVAARGGAAGTAVRAKVVEKVRAGQGQSIALLSYTSGTTGNPKGVIFTHRFLLDNAQRVKESLGFHPGDEYLSYVPFAWGTEQVFGVALGLSAPLVVNFPERPDTVPENLRELAVHSLFFGARQWEGLARTVQSRMLDAPKWQQALCNWCLRTAQEIVQKQAADESLTTTDQLSRWIADRLALRGIRDQLGLTRVRVALMGGAAMAPEVFQFFHALGVNVRNLYGCSEVGLLTAHTLGRRIRAETMGTPLTVEPCFGAPIELKLERSGELLVRGGTGFAGYWNLPENTAERLADGWFRTGDVVAEGPDRELVYVDRLADMRRLAGGATFSPQFIETRLRFSPFIKDLLVVGDESRPHVTALINIDPVTTGRWAEAHRVPFSGFSDLSQCAEVIELVRSEIRRVNALLPAHGRVRRFANLPKELDADEGELTRTRKLRREFVEKRYAQLIDALYSTDRMHRIAIDVLFQDGKRGRLESDVRLEEVIE